MNTVVETPVAPALTTSFTFAQLEPSVATACQRIAPTWPLDQFIAVNPYWGFVDQPVAAAARQLGEMSGTPLVMSRAFYRAELQAGRLTQAHLQGAIDAARADCDVAALLAGLNAEPAVQPAQTLITTLLDGERDLSHAVAWVDFVTHQVSQHCAAYFDVSQAAWNPERTGLYASWAAQAANDHSAALLMGYTGFGQRAAALARDARELIVAATLALGLQPAQCADYYSALLMSINGWSSWCAYERWQARMGAVPGQVDDDKIMELLAIRLAWEWLL